jgi:diguanylate cyclase (GGDEF)-like protein
MVQRWAETFRKVVEEKDWEAGGIQLKVTISFGVSWTEGIGKTTRRDLIAEADRRLYAAKGEGRNRVVAVG